MKINELKDDYLEQATEIKDTKQQSTRPGIQLSNINAAWQVLGTKTNKQTHKKMKNRAPVKCWGNFKQPNKCAIRIHEGEKGVDKSVRRNNS